MLGKIVRSTVMAILSLAVIAANLPAQPAEANHVVIATAPCLQAEFVSDVTVKDRSSFLPGESFTKTWRVKNTGTCTWTKNFTLVFVGGTRLSDRTEVRLKEKVKPGRTVDISVRMEAPEKVGHYLSYWMLRTDEGKRFGVGSANRSIWAWIVVGETPTAVYSFAGKFNQAVWHSANGGVPKSGDKDSPTGYARRANGEALETGLKLTASSLVVHPQWSDGGEVRGRYPDIVIETGDRFQATVGCLEGMQNCDVTFELRYRVPGERPYRLLSSWRQTYNGKARFVDVDLSEFAGKSVKFYLVVRNNGATSDAWAAWVNPTIVNQK